MSERAWWALYPEGSVLVGMVHLLPLPGSPGWGGSMAAVLERAAADGRALSDAGFDAVIVENYGDVPFHRGRVPAETVAALTTAVATVADELGLPVGVNVLRNDAASALGIVAATPASFIRVNVHTGSMWTDQGLLEGDAAGTLRTRDRLGLDAAILADVHVKHAVPPAGASLADAGTDAWHRGLADALLVTGPGTGRGTDAADVATLRAAVPDAPVLVASGVTPDTVAEVLTQADGAIVGSAVMHDGLGGQGVDPERARALVQAARA